MIAICKRRILLAGMFISAVLISACNDKGSKMADDKTNKQGRIQVADLYLAPESESSARAAALLPTNGTEDVSSILGTIPLPPRATAAAESEDKDYLPSTASEWVVRADLENPKELAVASVENLFGKEWRSKGGGNVTIYGKDARTGRWTFLISANGPNSVTALQFAWPYFATWTGDMEITKAKTYESRFKDIVNGMEKLGRAKVHMEVQPAAAQQRSERLSAVSEQFNRQIMLILKAPAGRTYFGRDV